MQASYDKLKWVKTDGTDNYFYKHSDDLWIETQKGVIFAKYKQIEANKDFVLLFDEKRAFYIKLTNGFNYMGKSKDILYFYTSGKWVPFNQVPTRDITTPTQKVFSQESKQTSDKEKTTERKVDEGKNVMKRLYEQQDEVNLKSPSNEVDMSPFEAKWIKTNTETEACFYQNKEKWMEIQNGVLFASFVKIDESPNDKSNETKYVLLFDDKRRCYVKLDNQSLYSGNSKDNLFFVCSGKWLGDEEKSEILKDQESKEQQTSSKNDSSLFSPSPSSTRLIVTKWTKTDGSNDYFYRTTNGKNEWIEIQNGAFLANYEQVEFDKSTALLFNQDKKCFVKLENGSAFYGFDLTCMYFFSSGQWIN